MMIVEYNGVTMRNCLTRDFEQEIVYDASSTDQLFCRYRMTFEGVITEAEAAPHVRSRHNPDSRAAVQLGVLRAALQAPRHTLTVKVVHWTYDAEGRPAASEERVLFQCHPEEKALADHHRDLSNGPKPKALKVLGVAGSRALRVSWTVECDMVELLYSADGDEHMGNETPPQHDPGPPALRTVLNNRWSLREEIDANFFLVRTTSGTLRLGRNVSTAGIDYRELCVPPLEPGFARERMLYTVDPTGLEVQYEITDRQVHTAAPWPATRMRVSHRRGTQDGVKFTAHCQARLEGPPFAPKTALLARAIQIIDFYTGLLANAQTYGRSYYVTNAELIEEVGEENAVEAHVTLAVLGDPTNADALGLDFIDQQLTELGKDLDLAAYPAPASPVAGPAPNPHTSKEPSPYGYSTVGGRDTALWWLMQCYLQRPWHEPHHIVRPGEHRGDEHATPSGSVSSPQVIRVSEIRRATGAENEFSDEHRQRMYNYARMENRYRIPQMRVACPLAAAPGESVAASGPTVAIARLGRAAAVRRILYDAERIGDWPELPEPQDTYRDGEATAYLAEYRVTPLPPTTGPTGRELLYRVRAAYTYLLDRPLPPGTPWSTGRLPHVRGGAPFQSPYAMRLGPTNTE